MKKLMLFGAVCLSILNAKGQSPFLDSTFGVGGRQIIAPTGSKMLNAIAADSNNCLYSAGIVNNGVAGTSILITKSKYNGTDDNTFGNQGMVIANYGSSQGDYLNAIAVTPSQKIVVGGYTTIGATKHALLARYKQNGNLDSTFGVNGVVTTLTGAYTQINELALQSDGKIIAAGTTQPTLKPAVWVARYNTDGSLDATFGTNGIDTFHNLATSRDTGIAVQIQQSGKIVVGGMTNNTSSGPGSASMMLLRLNADGSLDNTFGTSGFTVFINQLVSGQLIDIAVLTDGSIITNDYRSGSYSSVRPFVKKFSVNGVFDPTFSNTTQTANGMILDFAPGATSTASIISSLLATADGGVIGVGSIPTYGGSTPAIVKLKPNGNLDSAFGINGLINGYLPFQGSSYGWRYGHDAVIQKDGKIGVCVNIGTPLGLIELNRYTNIPLYLGPDRFICQGSSTTLNAQNAGSTYLWNTGATTQTISVSDTGNYYVKVTNPKGSVTDTIHIAYHPQPIVPLGNDTAICSGNTITLNAQNTGATYLWSNGATTQSIIVSTGGSYSVQVTNAQQCIGRDTLQLTVNPSPVIVNLGVDTTFCNGNSLVLDAQNAGASYLWSSGPTTQTISVAVSGTYSVVVTDASQCKGFDTIQVTVNPLPVVTLGNDTAFCAGNILDAGNAGASYVWSNGATTQSIAVTATSSYAVIVTDANGCSKGDTIQVTAYPLPVVDIGDDTLHAVNGTIVTLDAGNPGATYSWSDGGATQTHNVINTGWYGVIVTNTDGCTASDSIYIIFDLAVGIGSPNGDKEKITISPNPVTESITINIGGYAALLHQAVTIIDITGKVVRTFSIDKAVQSYSLADLKAGMYFLKTANGGNYKLIKQ